MLSDGEASHSKTRPPGRGYRRECVAFKAAGSLAIAPTAAGPKIDDLAVNRPFPATPYEPVRTSLVRTQARPARPAPCPTDRGGSVGAALGAPIGHVVMQEPSKDGI
jgi:hypothetical protein